MIGFLSLFFIKEAHFYADLKQKKDDHNTLDINKVFFSFKFQYF